MSDEWAETDEWPVPRRDGEQPTGGADKAREALVEDIAEAVMRATVAAGYLDAHHIAWAVVPLVEAATRELRADRDSWAEQSGRVLTQWQVEHDRAQKAEAERDQLWAVAEGRILHRFMGNCPDSLDGFDLRDPDCPACAALVQVGAADTPPEGHVLAMNAGQAWTCACGRAGINPQTPEGRGLTHAQHLRDMAVRCVCGHLRRGEHYTDSITDAVMCAICKCREFTPTAGSKVDTAPEATALDACVIDSNRQNWCRAHDARWSPVRYKCDRPVTTPADAAPESREGR